MVASVNWISATRRYLPYAAALALLISGGIVLERASAISPTVDSGREFRGAPNITLDVVDGQEFVAYRVPAGRQFTLTDIIVTNSTGSLYYSFVYVSDQYDCEPRYLRVNAIAVPSQSMVHLPAGDRGELRGRQAHLRHLRGSRQLDAARVPQLTGRIAWRSRATDDER